MLKARDHSSECKTSIDICQPGGSLPRCGRHDDASGPEVDAELHLLTIVYASTHEGGDACPARPDRSKGYIWAVYPTFDIYLATDAGKILKKLTTAPGYDAEATVNWTFPGDWATL